MGAGIASMLQMRKLRHTARKGVPEPGFKCRHMAPGSDAMRHRDKAGSMCHAKHVAGAVAAAH